MVKKTFALLLVVAMTLSMVACGTSQPAATEAPAPQTPAETEATAAVETPVEETKEVPEVSTITWARANSGNIFVTLATQLGYFEEYGLKVVEAPVASSTEALTALGAGQVDVTSNQGTNNPLAQIAAGQDFTIVGGYMLQGMYLVAKTGTGWNGPADLIGKKVAAPASTTTITGPLLDLGYDPIKDVEWLNYSTSSDRLSAVIAGEADYAYLSGDMLFTVGNNPEVEIVRFASDPDLSPAYGCCRMNMRTEFVKKNPITVKLMLKALIRAQAYFEANVDECVGILANEIGASEEYVAAYLKNPNYKIAVDPVKNSVLKTWEVMSATGFLPEGSENIDIESHINTELYETALNEVIAEHGDEYPEFFAERLAFFDQYNK